MPSSQTPVMLPSIREMFPEYLMRQPVIQTKSTASPHSHPYPPPRTFPAEPRCNTAVAMSAQQHRTGPVPRGPRAAATAVPALHHHPEPARASPLASYSRSIPADSPEFSFGVLRSDPTSSSLQHIASSLTSHPHVRNAASSSSSPSVRYAPAFRVSVIPEPPLSLPSSCSGLDNVSHLQPMTTTWEPDALESCLPNYSPPSFPGFRPGFYSTTTSQIGPGGDDVPLENASRHGSPASIADPDNVSDGELSSTGKKHTCSTCQKGFNRPSSLRIHVNTHTGATPFRCPWPDCGRQFNVNSNMRRHHRNHTASGSAASSSSSSSSGSQVRKDHHRCFLRKRRKLPPQAAIFLAGDSSVPAPLHPTTRPISSLPGTGPEYPHLRPQPRGPHVVPSSFVSSSVSDEDSAAGEASESSEHARLDNGSRTGVAAIAVDDDLEAQCDHPHRETVHFQRYSQSHLRSAVAVSPPHLPCLSSSLGPHRSFSSRQRIYTPSPAYARSASPQVSTTLRPTFNPAGVGYELCN